MPAKSKIQFTGSQGDQLAGLLEQPDSGSNGLVLLAHCFTCGKDIAAASRISRALVSQGFSVFRFDFTGLGNSDGDFANTNFSSNVGDLVAAADFLRQQFQAPSLLIGHSLGGTAVLSAAAQIPEVKGVATIGAPAEAEHVIHQFACDLESIERDGEARVTLANRQFTIKKQFIEDLRDTTPEMISRIDAALLVMHSPVDSIVSVTNAEKIYKAARHPKSFISLDDADHLLSKADDARYVADTISAWANRYLKIDSAPAATRPAVAHGDVLVAEKNRKFTQDIYTDSHHWMADEPTRVGGNNLGPDPYAMLLASLGACTSMTLRMYANRKQWPLKDVKVELQHHREHGDDCASCSAEHPQIDVITRTITIDGDLDSTQRARLIEIADRCPVHKTLHGIIEIKTSTA